MIRVQIRRRRVRLQLIAYRLIAASSSAVVSRRAVRALLTSGSSPESDDSESAATIQPIVSRTLTAVSTSNSLAPTDGA